MATLYVFKNTEGIYGLTPTESGEPLPPEQGPWSYQKAVNFDPDKPMIGASKNSQEIKQIIDLDGFYLDGPGIQV